jgi:hypothetical protein
MFRPPSHDDTGALIGRATFDVVGNLMDEQSGYSGPNNVKGGNLVERIGEIGAVDSVNRNERLGR